MNKITMFIMLLCTIFISCDEKQQGPLPFLGHTINVDGVDKKHTIRDFEYINQDSQTVTNQVLSSTVYVADFFFTSCPSICPKVAREMLKLHDEFKSNPQVKLVSFTLDPKRDTPSKLRLYADNLEVDTDKWMFLHGDKDFTLELAQDYFVTAMEDEEAPGGFNHSGNIILVDRQGHIRSFADGTDPSETPRLIKDIYRLLDEKP